MHTHWQLQPSQCTAAFDGLPRSLALQLLLPWHSITIAMAGRNYQWACTSALMIKPASADQYLLTCILTCLLESACNCICYS